LKAARLCPALLRVLLAAGVMGLVCALGLSLLSAFAFDDKSQAWIVVTCLVPMGVAVYFSVLYWLKFEELDALRNLLPGASMRR
jgi:phosphoglycerol transferase MdoB-like AlkP superfamily enzyme